MKAFQARLPDRLYDGLKEVADSREETIATNLRRAVEEYIKRHQPEGFADKV